MPTAILDGEVAWCCPTGRTSFNALQNAHEERRGGRAHVLRLRPALPRRLGPHARRRSRSARRCSRACWRAPARPLRYSEHVVGSGQEFFREACRLQARGHRLQAARRALHARPRARVAQDQVPAGAGARDRRLHRARGAARRARRAAPRRLRATGKLALRGQGGHRLHGEDAPSDLRRRLDRLAQKTSPFSDQGAGHGARALGEARAGRRRSTFGEWTPDGRLRHPAFKGLREDKAAREVVREKPVAAPARAPRRRLAIEGVRHHASRPRPLSGAGDHEARAGRVLRVDRRLDPAPPASTGRRRSCAAPRASPASASTRSTRARGRRRRSGRVKIQEKRKVGDYLVVDDLPGLVGLVADRHPRDPHLELAARAPGAAGPPRVRPRSRRGRAVARRDRRGARWCARASRTRGSQSFVKTTGGKGLHVVVPITRGPGWDECLEFSRGDGRGARRATRPRPSSPSMSKARRTGRIFIDYLRNQRGATSVAAYSTRAKPEAPVSTPLALGRAQAGRRVDALHGGESPAAARVAARRSVEGISGDAAAAAAERRGAARVSAHSFHGS